MIDTKFLKRPNQYVSLFLWVFAFWGVGCSSDTSPITENNFDDLALNSFVEPDFPFFSTYLDARALGVNFPTDNIVARGLALQLGDDAYACFDMDLLRWSVGWSGEQLPMVLMPQVSYEDFFKNTNDIPQVKGTPAIANGMYPGWTSRKVIHSEVRSAHQCREGFYWGAISREYGSWRGVYTVGASAVLSYAIGHIQIYEMPGALSADIGHVFTRTFEVDAANDTLYLNAAEVAGGFQGSSGEALGFIVHRSDKDTVTAVAVKSKNGTHFPVRAIGNQYLSVELPPSEKKREFTVYLWKGPATQMESFNGVVEDNELDLLPFQEGGPPRWKGKVHTKGRLAPDSAAFVVDVLTLPLPNPWNRNVRVMDIAFLSGRKAAVVTFEGDVWLVDGVSEKLNQLKWRRYASGLFEPMSIEVRDGGIYVFGKEGIVRLHDLNGDDEADYYENFSNAMHQSTESREYAGDMVLAADGGFFVAKGGSNAGGPGITPNIATSFRAGSNHSGTILKISRDGRKADVIATGLRMPYLGLLSADSVLSVTDQQGHFVPSTPIYFVQPGDYFGVPATKHSADDRDIKKPLTWIPHRVDRSAGSELWVSGGKMGPLNNSLLHFSFGRPGLFNVLVDTNSVGLQGGVTFIPANYVAPTIKGAVGPADGQVYMAGMNMFGSNSQGIAAIQRLRYTGQPSYLLAGFQAGKEGIILSFDSKLNAAAATDIVNYRVKRWNYKRTEQYGSGHYKSDGTAGEDVLPVLGAYLSADGKQVLLLVPDMKVIDQVEVLYDIAAQDGKPIDDGFWFSLHHAQELPYDKLGFQHVDLGLLDLSREEMEAMIKSDEPVTVDRGRELFAKTGCLGCHSTGRKTDGMYGPPFQGLYGSKVELTDGSVVTVDDAYLRESILEPAEKVVKGYNAEMPSYKGVLSDSDLESIIFYIKTLYR